MRLVLVDGRIAYQDGRFPRLGDGGEWIAEAQRLGRDIIGKAGLAHRSSPAWRR